MANIVFRYLKDKRYVTIKDICFRELTYMNPLPRAIRYPAQVDKTLDRKAVDKYCAFICRLFDDNRLTCHVVLGAKVPHVRWNFDTKGLAYKQILLRLTALRYTHEFPRLVKLFAALEGDDEQVFAAFQKIHHDSQNNHLDQNLNGHGLIGWYGVKTNVPVVSIAQFRANLKTDRGVHEYFS